MKTYRGSAAAARNYVEADRRRADDYYLAEGTGVAERLVASPGAAAMRVEPLTGDAYEAWVAGVDPVTGVAKGRLRHDHQAVRFVEVTVNGPKSWSLAAELHPDINAAYDAAQDRAATQIVEWLAAHSTTRVGPRGAQVQVPVTEIDAAVVRHHTSRAGDPHRHLHLQINSRVFAAGKWRGLHTVGTRDSLDAINGIGHAAVMTDPGFRAALAAHGLTLDGAGEVEQLAPFTGAFSARAAQIGRTLDRYETDWNEAHLGKTAGPQLRRTWDARAWAHDRPDKITPEPGADLNGRWLTELAALGYRNPSRPVALKAPMVGSLSRDQAVEQVLVRLAAKRSGWNAADVRGEVEQLITRRGIVTESAVRVELAEDLTARTVTRCVPLLQRSGVPEHVRALTSEHVLGVENDLAGRLAARGTPAAGEATLETPAVAAASGSRLDETQLVAARVLAGAHQLVVLEGAAGAGKTTTLAAARDLLEQQGRRLTVVTPTLKAAKVAQAELGSHAGSAAALVFQHGFRWDESGRWTRLQPGQRDPVTGRDYTGPSAGAVLRARDLVLVDEAGMLDQDSARALLTVADEHHVRVALVGDRHQLSAVGRGGVLDLAARWVDPAAHLTLDSVHRFTRTSANPDGTVEVVPDVEYADLSLAMRSGENADDVFDTLLDRGQVRVHATPVDRLATLADLAAIDVADGSTTLVVADTRDQVAELNAAIRDRLVTAGLVDDTHSTTTTAGQRIGVGDRVTTRRNDSNLDVANRDTWTVTHVKPDGAIEVTGHPGTRQLPAEYAAEHVELAYAGTVHGVQGATADAGHLLLGEHTGASSAYVGMTRGRSSNVVHIVADGRDVDDARRQWVATFARDRADLGPAHAAELAAEQAANYARPRPLEDVLVELHEAWTSEQQALDRLANVEPAIASLRQIVAVRTEQDTRLPVLKTAAQQAREDAIAAAAHVRATAAVVARDADRIRDALLTDWDNHRPAATRAAQTVTAGAGVFGQRRADVTAAKDALADWSGTWQPYLPGMPTDLDAVVHHAAQRDNRPGIIAAFDDFARHRSVQLHPEHATAHSAAEHAQVQERQAGAAYRDAVAHYNELLWRHGTVGHTPDPAGLLTERERILTDTRYQLDHARTEIAALTCDPAVISQPADRLAAERDRWQHIRDSAALAANTTIEADTRQASLRAASSHEHDQPRHREPQHGPGLGR